MIFELLHAPFPGGYGEALVPLVLAKRHLSVEGSIDDALIAALRDASIEFIERYCSVKLGPVTGLVWKAERFPACDRTALCLGAGPVTAVPALAWLDSDGATVHGVPADFRVSLHGDLLPAIGGSWPSGVAGAVSITFSAGYAVGAAPAGLLAAARMFLAHLYMNREAVITGTITAEVPF